MKLILILILILVLVLFLTHTVQMKLRLGVTAEASPQLLNPHGSDETYVKRKRIRFHSFFLTHTVQMKLMLKGKELDFIVSS